MKAGNATTMEYVWLGNNPDMTIDIRSKTRVQYNDSKPAIWNYDGSSTNQAPGDDSEVLLRPVETFADPFRNPEKDLLVLCENMKLDKETGKLNPIEGNMRSAAEKIMEAAKSETPRFGIEQEFFLLDSETGKPVGFRAQDEAQGNFYCGVNGAFVHSKVRVFYEKFLQNCATAGVRLSGANLEVAVGQIEFQVDNYGISVGDHLWMSRYIALRTAQDMDCYVDFSTRVLDGDWNGSGCHTNFSIARMMEPEGWAWIENTLLPKMEKNAMKHIERYGPGNVARLSGKHETAPWKKFSWGVASRADSVRIPTTTYLDKKGYIEDRRPSSCMNPYVVTGLLVQTALDVCPEIEFTKDTEISAKTDAELGRTRMVKRPLL